MLIRSLGVLLLAAISGCAGPRVSTEFAPPPAGYAKLYVLRPTFSVVSRSDTPTLYINDRASLELRFGTYTEFLLEPGTYELSLEPRPSESAIFRGAWSVAVMPDQSYFIAIWNDVEYQEEIHAWYLGLPMPYVVTKASNSSLRFEAVSEADALAVLRTLKRVTPIDRFRLRASPRRARARVRGRAARRVEMQPAVPVPPRGSLPLPQVRN